MYGQAVNREITWELASELRPVKRLPESCKPFGCGGKVGLPKCNPDRDTHIIVLTPDLGTLARVESSKFLFQKGAQRVCTLAG